MPIFLHTMTPIRFHRYQPKSGTKLVLVVAAVVEDEQAATAQQAPRLLLWALTPYPTTALPATPTGASMREWARYVHWNPAVVMMPTLPSLVVQENVIMTTYGATSGDKVGTLTTLGSQFYEYTHGAVCKQGLYSLSGRTSYHIDMAQAVEILPPVRQGPAYSSQSISWLLMI